MIISVLLIAGFSSLLVSLVLLTVAYVRQRRLYEQILNDIKGAIEELAKGEGPKEINIRNSASPKLLSSIIDGVKKLSEEKMEREERLSDLEKAEKAMLNLLEDMDETKKELHRMSITDELTGLYNRRMFYQVLEEESRRAEAEGRPFSLMIMDLDNFKAYNDEFGHLEGDRALQEIAKVFEEAIRKDKDKVFRMGGDEFAIVLPDTTKGLASVIANRIRERLRERWDGRFSISIGITQYRPGTDITKLIQRADKAMYEEKKRKKSGNAGTDKEALPN